MLFYSILIRLCLAHCIHAGKTMTNWSVFSGDNQNNQEQLSFLPPPGSRLGSLAQLVGCTGRSKFAAKFFLP